MYPHVLVSYLWPYIYNDSLYVCSDNKLCHCDPLKCDLTPKEMADQLPPLLMLTHTYVPTTNNLRPTFLQTLSSYDVASGSEITPCNKIDKPLVAIDFGKHYDVHNNVAYIMAK